MAQGLRHMYGRMNLSPGSWERIGGRQRYIKLLPDADWPWKSKLTHYFKEYILGL